MCALALTRELIDCLFIKQYMGFVCSPISSSNCKVFVINFRQLPTIFTQTQMIILGM